MQTDFDESITMLDCSVARDRPSIMQRGRLKTTMRGSEYKPQNNSTIFQTTMDMLNRVSFGDILASQTIMDMMNQTENPVKQTGENMYMEFLEIMQANANSNQVVELISDFSNCCADTYTLAKGLKTRYADELGAVGDTWLEHERNTWRLFVILYQNRLNTDSNIFQDLIYTGFSEKRCMQLLFKRDAMVTEIQLIIDWLEFNARDRQDDNDPLDFEEGSIGWEHTLHQLQSKATMAFRSDRNLVTELHPDAPYLEGKQLHELDEELETKLCRRMFLGVRAGQFDEAMKRCERCGHGWRSAMMQGWRLFHDPRNTVEDGEPDIDVDKLGIVENAIEYSEGNANRDVWKKIAWAYCQDERYDDNEKATLGVYCGNLRSILQVSKSWEDFLWAYLKVNMDIRVESEIRDNVNKSYCALPEQYWAQRMSVNEIFERIEDEANDTVKRESMLYNYVVQKYLILDDTAALLDAIERIVVEPTATFQCLRFFAHLVIVLDKMGRISKRAVYESAIKEYVNRLVDKRNTQLVSFYVSKLGNQDQVSLYAAYLENVTDNDERKECLEYGEQSGLDMVATTKQIAANIRSRSYEIGDCQELQPRLSELDELRISSVDWLLFFEEQRLEALIHCNAIIFKFITLKKYDGAQITFNKLPSNIAEIVMAESSSDIIQKSTREYFSYKVFLEAQDSFSSWFRTLKSKPVTLDPLSDHATYTEKIAHEQRSKLLNIELERWQIQCAQACKVTQTFLYNVLLFPSGGWLSESVTPDAHYLRRVCIPETVLMLHSVLHESEQYAEAVRVADILMSKKYELYKVYSSEKLVEIFLKIAESSTALLHLTNNIFGA